MAFYSDWLQCKNLIEKSSYLKNFIEAAPESSAPLLNGSEKELNAAYNVISETPLVDFFEIIEGNISLPQLTAANIPCFSSLERGASRVNEILEFSPNGLTFDQLGLQLMNSKKEGAQKKYGENQAKLALSMDFVYFVKSTSILVCPTAWGSYLTQYTFEQKKNIIKKMLLRDPCVKTLLHYAFWGPVRYYDIVSFLKPSTMIRRRTNVKCLVSFILSETEREVALSNIEWDVEDT